jgi:hypothetical protein
MTTIDSNLINNLLKFLIRKWLHYSKKGIYEKIEINTFLKYNFYKILQKKL